ncbi:MAG: MerR family transcriptional regulator [Candidatus Omnitrophica bacterium]|nr:MerR family transcriptional regulator [Candidatus Omnitrophota bacterium]MCK5178812.1 MerR family transcriptional regulator [Candidatus Omnitrophota bacterium]MCK5259836.1 MerR family transcriptional regulator [Candidatus Omnitrophota bacterium]
MNCDYDNRFGMVETVKQVGISPERLRYWEQAGIIRPEYVQCGARRFRRYSQEDIDRGIYVRILVDGEKYSLEGAKRKLESER